MKRAVFPGSFDPFTKGHESVINRACDLFDEIYIAIGINSNKKYLFSLEDRKKWIESTFVDNSKIKVITYDTLTTELCKKLDAKYILRGLRNSADFNFEYGIAQTNRDLVSDIETIFLLTDLKYATINSSIVRDIYVHGGDIKQFIPNAITI
ncbi:MAG: pantetheine-phosphate adenylyltransferase [Bacteroidetes bacterium]|nr:MAG: pantetheine-phosphate adenylyltransferase [Bacteroidota bacterium]